MAHTHKVHKWLGWLADLSCLRCRLFGLVGDRKNISSFPVHSPRRHCKGSINTGIMTRFLHVTNRNYITVPCAAIRYWILTCLSKRYKGKEVTVWITIVPFFPAPRALMWFLFIFCVWCFYLSPVTADGPLYCVCPFVFCCICAMYPIPK